MNNSIYFILILIGGISCAEPEQQNDLSEIYDSLSEQKHFYYNVEYTVNNTFDKTSASLYGMVSLNRSLDSGVSSAYFGQTQKQLPNYLHSIYLENDWIHKLSSNVFEMSGADVITDSLHSPIMINPEFLFEVEARSNAITQQEMNGEKVKWIFDLKHKTEQLILVWNEKSNKIAELEYRYDVNSDDTYSRKWSFDYLLESEYSQLASKYNHQNQVANQPFL